MTRQLIKTEIVDFDDVEFSDGDGYVTPERVDKDMRQALGWLNHCCPEASNSLVYNERDQVLGVRMVLPLAESEYSVVLDCVGYLCFYCIDFSNVNGDIVVDQTDEIATDEYDCLPNLIGALVGCYFNEVLCED